MELLLSKFVVARVWCTGRFTFVASVIKLSISGDGDGCAINNGIPQRFGSMIRAFLWIYESTQRSNRLAAFTKWYFSYRLEGVGAEGDVIFESGTGLGDSHEGSKESLLFWWTKCPKKTHHLIWTTRSVTWVTRIGWCFTYTFLHGGWINGRYV